MWLHPSDPTVVAHLHLAWIRLVQGDLIDAEAELVHAARRAGQLGFPQGPFSLAYTRCMECWIRVEAGQLDRAAVLAADLTEQAERHGFDMFRVWGEALQAALSALAFVDADDPDPAGLSARIATMATCVDILHMVGMNVYITFHDAVLGRLLIAAGQPEQARARLDTALQLAQDTGMCFYDAELLRLRAHTHTDPETMQADISAALDLARRQGAPCSNCAPPSTISSCAASPRALPSPTRPAESPPTARSRNWRGPRPRRSRPTRNSGSSAASRSGGRSLGIPDPTTSSVSCGKRHPRSLPEATDSLSPQSRRLGAASPGVMLPPQ